MKAECALRDHPALGRWLRQLPSGRLVIDRAKVAAEERLDGKYLLSTTDPDLTAEDIALGYKNLLEAERGFRDLKSTLELRPVFHRLEPRIRAHVLLCWLALLLIRVAERRTGLTWRPIARELGRLHAVTLTGSAGSVVQTTELTDTQRGIYRPCEVTPPPRSPPTPRLTSANAPTTAPARRRHTTRTTETGASPCSTSELTHSLTYQLRNPGSSLVPMRAGRSARGETIIGGEASLLVRGTASPALAPCVRTTSRAVTWRRCRAPSRSR